MSRRRRPERQASYFIQELKSCWFMVVILGGLIIPAIIFLQVINGWYDAGPTNEVLKELAIGGGLFLFIGVPVLYFMFRNDDNRTRRNGHDRHEGQ